MNSPGEIFGAAARTLRETLGKSQYEMGEMLGRTVRNTTVFRYESGRSVKPEPKVLLRYAQIAYSDARTAGLLKDFAKLSEGVMGMPPLAFVFAVLLMATGPMSGPDAPKHAAKLAKRAAEILEGE
jgi:transcriptional regulator with XRE-family HTH domain